MGHDNVICTSCTFLIDNFSTTTFVWGHVITLPSDTEYDATSQESENSYAKFYYAHVCSYTFQATIDSILTQTANASVKSIHNNDIFLGIHQCRCMSHFTKSRLSLPRSQHPIFLTLFLISVELF